MSESRPSLPPLPPDLGHRGPSGRVKINEYYPLMAYNFIFGITLFMLVCIVLLLMSASEHGSVVPALACVFPLGFAAYVWALFGPVARTLSLWLARDAQEFVVSYSRNLLGQPLAETRIPYSAITALTTLSRPNNRTSGGPSYDDDLSHVIAEHSWGVTWEYEFDGASTYPRQYPWVVVARLDPAFVQAHAAAESDVHSIDPLILVPASSEAKANAALRWFEAELGLEPHGDVAAP